MDNKDVEFIVEKKKLSETLEILNNEILSALAKRKAITEYILEYRKNFIDEYKDDEDAVIEFFDHERYAKEEAFKTIDRKLKEMTILKESPYFGRVTFIEDKEQYPESLYIGRFGVTNENDLEPVVIDWRAPIASLFYHGTLGKAKYKAPMGEIETEILGRRQIIVKKGTLEGIFDSEIDVKDDILQKILSENSSEKLRDIIMTIQQEQDDIIRMSREINMVVDGVAGSGKTTIALHRVAYLLYNYRKALEGRVLILGPNSIFMEYISQVLPSLGEVGVKQDTFVNFALNELKDIEVMDFQEYIEKIYSGEEEFLNEVKYKNSNKFTNFIENFIIESERNYFNLKDVCYYDEVVYSKEEIEKLFIEDYKYMPLFKRSEKIKRVIISRIKNKRDERVWKLNKEIEEYKKTLTSEQLVLEELNLEFSRRIKIREIVREVINSRKAVDEFMNCEKPIELYNRINEYRSLTHLDLAPILYLMVKLWGAKYRGDIKHIVIDEAQDYSKLQFMAIKEYIGCNSFTILGDSNQRLVKLDEKPAMLNLSDIFGEDIHEFKLNKSYRSTKEIMEYANKYLQEEKIIPLVRSGDVVKEYTCNNEDLLNLIIKEIKEMQQEGLGSIAVIKKDVNGLKELGNLIKEEVSNVVFDREEVIYNGGIVLIPSYFAKGLEFDGVIILDEDEDNNKENLIKYIMSTRALHRLTSIKVEKR
ncbi:HelD family protein [Clostridium sp. 'White wine YQ']|uniref:HelD family protein n=1 Tax=Clostridium sp. 'White wine YQ' TaxID=3027474 RepID=UPI00236517DD|nr:UvrD-helicase domain-containing protein [Clostridium sp. 'White wine YQ']MDD7795027.1 AAA family ATPase [Clostridium sp. 'White wine YQ']